MRYWVDADVLITANRDYYPLGISTGFWVWMDTLIADGNLVSTRRCFNEVIKGRDKDDLLLKWMHRHKKELCLPLHQDAETIAMEIADHVWTAPRYPGHQRLQFSKGGDAWLIASAKQDGGTVLSNESNLYPEAKKVRIPDLCEVFQVRCRTMIQMIKEIPGASF